MAAKFEIKYPESITYWIAYTNKTTIFSFGQCDTDQCLSSGQKYFFQTLDREEWKNKLIKEFNTDPDASPDQIEEQQIIE